MKENKFVWEIEKIIDRDYILYDIAVLYKEELKGIKVYYEDKNVLVPIAAIDSLSEDTFKLFVRGIINKLIKE